MCIFSFVKGECQAMRRIKNIHFGATLKRVFKSPNLIVVSKRLPKEVKPEAGDFTHWIR